MHYKGKLFCSLAGYRTKQVYNSSCRLKEKKRLSRSPVLHVVSAAAEEDGHDGNDDDEGDASHAGNDDDDHIHGYLPGLLGYRCSAFWY